MSSDLGGFYPKFNLIARVQVCKTTSGQLIKFVNQEFVQFLVHIKASVLVFLLKIFEEFLQCKSSSKIFL